MSRRCEARTAGGGWVETAREALRPGMVFRLFEADGAPVVEVDELSGERVDRWRVLEVPWRDGNEVVVPSEPIAESAVERAVREVGFFWPNGARPSDASWAPRRLR